jgi:PAS domain S-box-containing protein
MGSEKSTVSDLHAAILAQLTEGVIVADAQGQITYVNEAAERLHGVAKLGVPPSGYSETYHLFTEDGHPYPPDQLPLSRAIRGEIVLDARWRILRPDGTSILAIGSARPIRDGSGSQVAAVLTLRDDTQRDAAERQLLESEARLRALTDNLPGGMVYQISTGADGSERQFLFVSQSHEQLTGIPASDVLQDPSIAYELIHPNDRLRVAEAEQAAIRSRKPLDVQVRFRRVDGEERWCRILSAPREQDDDSLIWDGIQIDTTDQHTAEAALRKSEERFRLTADAVPQIVWITDAEGRVEFFNKQWSDYTGVPYEPTTASEVAANHLHPDDTAATIEAFERSRSTGTTYLVEHRIRSRDGDHRWFLVRGEPYRDPITGEIIRWFGASVDIHDRKLAEAALRELNDTLEEQVAVRTAELRRYHDIVDATAAPICAFDTDFRLIAFNRAHNDEFRRVNGFDTKIGDVFPDLFIPEQVEVIRALMSRALSGESFTVVEEFGRPELGTPCWEITYTPLRDEHGKVIGAFHHAIDISARLRAQAELERAQEALRQSQKMEAMGSLTGGVAHDFNNLLTPIVGSLDLLHRKALGSEREQRLIDGALQSAERAKTLVQRLLAFARRQPLKSTAVDIGRLVKGMTDLLSSTAGPQVQVFVDVADDLPPAEADANQLEMALLNLGVNARDAMPNGGTLRISAVRESLEQSQGELAPGHYICLSLADTGMGMDDATLARAVEPFFSTKGIGRGTGLGLSMAHGLAAQLGGALKIESRVGAGTTVELWLPISAAPLPDAEPRRDPIEVVGARGLALLVDDEDLVRASTADMLAELGYEVEEAASAEAALALVNEGLRPDLLVTDHLMPGMTGVDLIRAVHEMRPELPALIVSGYAEAEGIAPELPRLTKPFRRGDLVRKLGELRLEEAR